MTACLLFVPLSAWAGHYDEVYSGGSGATDNTGKPIPFAPNGGSYGGTGYLPVNFPTTVQTLDVVGPLTATFTWNNDGDATSHPPPSVIITQTSTVSYNISNGQGYLNIGMGASGTYDTYTSSLSGVLYTEKDTPGPSFSVTTPNILEAKVTTDGSAYCGSDTASITYSASVSPFSMNLTGPTPLPPRLGRQDPPLILVGQGCTSSWSGIPDIPGATYAYNWTVPGNTFQSWTVNVDNVGNPNSAVLVGGLGPLTNPTAHWYWSDTAAYGLHVIGSVTVTPPAGQGAPFSLNKTQSVSLVVPTTTENPTTGRVQINGLDPGDYGPGYSLYAGGNATQPYGIVYTTQVNTQSPFSPGIWNMVQLVTPGTWYTPSGQAEQANPGNGIQGLDTRYPFYPSGNPSYPTGIPANNLKAQPYDGPGVGSLQDTNVRYRVSDNYSTYVMFLPPGSDTQWVPLWAIGWNWNADDSIPGISWTTWNNATDAGIVRVGSTVSTIAHPIWSQLNH